MVSAKISTLCTPHIFLLPFVSHTQVLKASLSCPSPSPRSPSLQRSYQAHNLTFISKKGVQKPAEPVGLDS